MSRKRPATSAGRVGAITGLPVLITLLAIPMIAQASVSGPCDGSVVIDGVTYTPANDSPSNPIVIPDKDGLSADWEGSTSNPIKNYTGEVSVVVGPTAMKIADWAGANQNERTSMQGSYSLDKVNWIPPGLYEVSATHSGEGGSCSGKVTVKVEGNPLANPVGQAATGVLVLSLVGLLIAGKV